MTNTNTIGIENEILDQVDGRPILRTGSTYIYDGDSSYWVEVWDAASNRIERIDTGRLFSRPSLPQPNAGPVAVGLANTEYRRQVAENTRRQHTDRLEHDLHTINVGNRARVVKGRKVPVGVEGTVFWLGEGGWGFRAGLCPHLEGHDGQRCPDPFWLALDNLERVPQPNDIEVVRLSNLLDLEEYIEDVQGIYKVSGDVDVLEPEGDPEGDYERFLENRYANDPDILQDIAEHEAQWPNGYGNAHTETWPDENDSDEDFVLKALGLDV